MTTEEEIKPECFLCVDWGASRCGLAVADSETRIATGVEEVKTSGLFERIKQLNEERIFSKVIIGKTSHDGFSDGKKTKSIEEDLKKLDLQVEFEEEFFSTKQAWQNLADTGKRGISKSDNIESARIILQSWLDR
ncbi:MAG: RuvX/YqgF family protein [Patescibacteria group bacterium]|nr:RuvX/YqgF family protein [Patescibacteria group bacterium]